MTTEVTNSYTDDQKAVAVAAYRKYGLRPTLRMLNSIWNGEAPHHTTVLIWSRDERIVVTDTHRDFWDDYDRMVQTEVKQRIAPLFERMADTIERQLDKPDDMERMSKVQGLTISLGILYDKVFPVAKNGAINVNATEGATVNLMVVAAPEQAQARAIADAD